ncbi:hypothetical protein [Pseudomonas promysalinigenes]|uniref:hypothetical protein n=1 Tax=Pseudomonas promysalinigenes TaxID=485898 RepID=UPI003FA0EDD7
MNYFVVHRASNSIVRIVASSRQPSSTDEYKFVQATDGYMNLFYERQRQAAKGQFVDLYSVIPKPKISETIPLSESDREVLTEYVHEHKDRETVQRMSWIWRVSEREVNRIIKGQ